MQIKAKTVAEYLGKLAEPRRGEVARLHKSISAAVPKLKSHIMCGMIGYGTYHYKYASGREGDWPVIALASQKNHISVYICATKGGRYLPEANQARLGKVSCGKSCIRFKRADDLDLKVLVELCKEAAKLMRPS